MNNNTSPTAGIFNSVGAVCFTPCRGDPVIPALPIASVELPRRMVRHFGRFAVWGQRRGKYCTAERMWKLIRWQNFIKYRSQCIVLFHLRLCVMAERTFEPICYIPLG